MLVAITQRNDLNKHGEKADNLENNYITYFEHLGFTLLLIPNTTEHVNEYFNAFPIKGVILTGGNDINSALTGEVNPNTDYSQERDSTEKNILDIALENNLPVLGCCRGMQFLNVYFGGKTKWCREVTNHQVRVDHNVEFVNQDYFSGKAMVNSYHDHCITREVLSPELKAFALCGKIVEGLYYPGKPIAGIQWHPERKSVDTETNKSIILAFKQRKLFWE